MPTLMTDNPRRGSIRWTYHGADRITARRMKGSCARMLTARVICPRHYRNCVTPTFYADQTH